MRSKLFLLFLAVLVLTFFARDNYRGVTDIRPEVLRDPSQTEIKDPTPINFEKDGFKYELSPLFNYEISGLVVHRRIYNRWYSLSRTDSVFPIDLCVIWGENVKSGVYKYRDVKFSQDSRWCWYKYKDGHVVINEAGSNNHLVIRDDDFERLANKIRAGDQIRLTGKLVNVEAKPLFKPERYEPKELIWLTSTIRTDTGAGACETIFVEGIEILKKGNTISSFLFTASLYGIVAVILWFIAGIIMEAYGLGPPIPSV